MVWLLAGESSMEISFTRGTIKEIYLKEACNALLLSDFHVADDSSSYFSSRAIEETLAFLPILIKEEQPNQIFLLGDIFHGSVSYGSYVELILSSLLKIKQPVYVIGGNHDREVIFKSAEYWSKQNLHIFPDYFLKVQTKNGMTIWLTHDGGNGYWLDKTQVPDFINSLKQAYGINKSEWMITGHTHFPVVIEDVKVASLGCFNLEGHNQPLSYGKLIETTDEGQIILEITDATELYHKVNS